tara:strand:+ start:180 stop:2942 length:2763 start_codon:yes stop_codon:yes gene_type:complete
MATPAPRQTHLAIEDDLEFPTHERFEQAVMRKWEGARNAENLSLEDWFNTNAKVKMAGVTADEATMRPLFEALHGERAIETLPANLRPIYDDIDNLRRLESQDMLEFLDEAVDADRGISLPYDAGALAGKVMAHPDYFWRAWRHKPTGTVITGRLGARPGFVKPRVDASFGEMVEAGYEPVSWNPYVMMAQRRLSGLEHRESAKLVNRLKQAGKALPEDEYLALENIGAVKNWRQPRDVGPALGGWPLPDGTYTPRLYVPPDVAGFLETSFGRRPQIHVGGKNIVEGIRHVSNALKRIKLVGSLFQHVDFGARSLFVTFTPTALRRGGPFRYPSLVYRLLKNTYVPNARNNLRKQLLSTDEIVPNTGVSNKMLIEEGWGVHGDISAIRREASRFLREEGAAGNWATEHAPRVVKVLDFFESGLFDGLYREAQRHALETFIVPVVKRQHPDWTARQVAGESAARVNEMFSTLGSWQTVLKDPALKEFAQTLMFSTNESEAMIRQGLGLVHGNSKRFWGEYYLGVFLGLATVGNVINLAATGKPLPKEAYSPLKLNDPYAPFKVGYNSQFLSPQIPLVKGRNGTPVYLDTVGQMDTALRWATDPASATAARYNVVPRAVANQVQGETFFGEKLEGPVQRGVQAAIDVGLPIPAASAIEAVRQVSPAVAGVVPEQEGRLGTTGSLLQATGINLRSMSTLGVLNLTSEQMGFGPKYRDLEPYQKVLVRWWPEVRDEILTRQKTGAERGSDLSKYYTALDRIDWGPEGRIAQLQEMAEGRAGYFEIRKVIDKARGQRKEAGIEREFEDQNLNDLDPNRRALAQYYALFDKPSIRSKSGLVDFAKFDLEVIKLRFSPAQMEYIRRNSNLQPYPVRIVSRLPSQMSRAIQVAQREREDDMMRRGLGHLIPFSRRVFQAEERLPLSSE